MKYVTLIVFALAIGFAANASAAKLSVKDGTIVWEETVATRCFTAGSKGGFAYSMREGGQPLDSVVFLLSPIDKKLHTLIAKEVYAHPDTITDQRAAIEAGRSICQEYLNLPPDTTTRMRINETDWRCFNAGSFAASAYSMRDAGVPKKDVAFHIPPDRKEDSLPVLDYLYAHPDEGTDLRSAITLGRALCRDRLRSQ